MQPVWPQRQIGTSAALFFLFSIVLIFFDNSQQGHTYHTTVLENGSESTLACRCSSASRVLLKLQCSAVAQLCASSTSSSLFLFLVFFAIVPLFLPLILSGRQYDRLWSEAAAAAAATSYRKTVVQRPLSASFVSPTITITTTTTAVDNDVHSFFRLHFTGDRSFCVFAAKLRAISPNSSHRRQKRTTGKRQQQQQPNISRHYIISLLAPAPAADLTLLVKLLITRNASLLCHFAI